MRRHGGLSPSQANACMLHARFGESRVNNFSGFQRLAVLGLAVLALGLAGCGRKGGLDLPPQAQAAAGAPPSDNAERLTQTPNVTGPMGIFDATAAGEEDRPAAARGQKRRIFLDPLLD